MEWQYQSDTTTILVTTTPPINPAGNWFMLLFVLFFFSIWNTVCSAFVYPSLQRILQGDSKGILMLFCTCLLPHIPIGFITPYMFGGVRFELVAIWPYYVATYVAIRSRYDGEPRRLFTSITEGPTGPIGRVVRSTSNDILRSHSEVGPALKKIFSGEAAKFPERYRLAREQLAGDNAECAVCFEPLCVAPVSCLVDAEGLRQCSHFFHRECIQMIMDTMQLRCPLCRCEFAGNKRLPQVGEDPDVWFALINSSGSGVISSQELLEGLKAVLPLDTKALESKVHETFGGRIYLTYEDVMHPTDGIYVFVKTFWEELEGQSRCVELPGAKVSVANTKIDGDRRALFDAWDTKGNNRLDVAEVLRGYLKTFGPTPNAEAEVYHTYVKIDGNFGKCGGITYDEFSREGGLLDTLLERLGQQWPVVPLDKSTLQDVELQQLIGSNATS